MSAACVYAVWFNWASIVLGFASGALWWVSASVTNDKPLTADANRIDYSFLRIGARWSRAAAFATGAAAVCAGAEKLLSKWCAG